MLLGSSELTRAGRWDCDNPTKRFMLTTSNFLGIDQSGTVGLRLFFDGHSECPQEALGIDQRDGGIATFSKKDENSFLTEDLGIDQGRMVGLRLLTYKPFHDADSRKAPSELTRAGR